VYGNQFFVPLNRENRVRAGVEAGQVVSVAIEVDDAPRVVEVPDDLARALRTAKLRARFDKLSYTHQREYVAWINDAKRVDTRERRIAGTIDKLRA
jgi:uncharacterized protein YdeI (YjbR/CyaY-like superfamily)